MKSIELGKLIGKFHRNLGLFLVILISFVFGTYSLFEMKNNLESTISVTSQIVAKNVLSSLEFSDKDSARDTLSSLENINDTISAHLYNEENMFFAGFSKFKSSPKQKISEINKPEVSLKLKEGNLLYYFPIISNNVKLGTLVTTTSLEKVKTLLIKFTVINIFFILTVYLITYFTTYKLKEVINSTLILFKNVMQNIKDSSEYTARLPKEINAYHGIVEFKELGESFNQMCDKIESQNKLISDTNENLEELVQKRTEELDQEKVKLIQAGKMASLGEMASGIAHEINNPLAIMSSHIHIMDKLNQKDTLSKEKLESSIKKLSMTIKRISSIISGLKSFSRDTSTQSYSKEKVSDILDETLQFCAQRFQSGGVKLIIEDFDKELTIYCNPTQISQVILNLLNNSFDAIKDDEKPWVTFNASEKENVIEIRTVDSGKGIPKDIQQKILEPFFTTKEIGKGTGLGLSISKGIIENHKGRFYIDNNHVNTSFVVELPKT